MDNGKDEQCIGKLAMEPYILVERQKAELRPDNADERAAHWEQNERGID